MNTSFAIIFTCGAAQLLHAQSIRALPNYENTLRRGTSLQINILGVPTEDAEGFRSQEFVIAADGCVTLPFIGQVMVAGLTFSQAEAAIERIYVSQNIYRQPTVTVRLRQWRPPTRLDASGPGYREQIKRLRRQMTSKETRNHSLQRTRSMRHSPAPHPLTVMLIPIHPLAFIAFMLWQITFNVIGHAGYEIFPRWMLDCWLGKFLNTPTNHIMHHEHFGANYGLYFNVWDRLMGTNHERYAERFREVTRRSPT